MDTLNGIRDTKQMEDFIKAIAERLDEKGLKLKLICTDFVEYGLTTECVLEQSNKLPPFVQTDEQLKLSIGQVGDGLIVESELGKIIFHDDSDYNQTIHAIAGYLYL